MVNKEKWGELIKDWNNKTLPKTINRETVIPLEPKTSRAIILIGPRRAGKTYEMFITIKRLLEKTIKEKTLYLNLERSDLGTLKYQDLNKMLEAYNELFPETKNEELYLFLDEIQNVEGWEKFVRTCLDEGIKIYLTGSSSKLLSKEIATSMAGRSLTYTIMPFSYKEYLHANKIIINKYYSTKEKSLMKNLLNEYLKWGGYPETVVYTGERERILRDIYDTAILRDLEGRYHIRNTALLRNFTKALINAEEFSVNKYYNYTKSVGMKTSKNTLYNYLRYLEEAFIIIILKKYGKPYKENTTPKIYFIDNGLLTINGVNDHGKMMENLILGELVRRNYEASYWKNYQNEEVDFVMRKGTVIRELIQSCYDIKNPDTKKREVRALIKASKELRCDNLKIITKEQEEIITHEGKKILVIPLWKWLLKNTKKRPKTLTPKKKLRKKAVAV